MTSVQKKQENYDNQDILSVELEDDAVMSADPTISVSMFDSGISADLTNSRHSEAIEEGAGYSPTKENFNSETEKCNGLSPSSTVVVLAGDAIEENGEDHADLATSESGTEASNEPPLNDSDMAANDRKMVKRVSFVKLLHDSPHKVCDSTDLDQELAIAINDVMNSYTHDKTLRAAKIEQAIQIKRESIDSPRRQRGHFSSSPINSNATRYCRRPKAHSEDGSPHRQRTSSGTRYPNLNPMAVNSISLPMDRFSVKLFNPPDRAATHLGVSGSPRHQYQNGGGVFGGRGRSPRHYIIHPEWVSESFNVQKLPLSNRSLDFTDKSKRSQSCPPVSRNVITWASPDKSPDQ